MNHVLENYCNECEWSASSADHTVHERSRLAINHAIATGHNIDCVLRGEVQPNDSFPTRRGKRLTG